MAIIQDKTLVQLDDSDITKEGVLIIPNGVEIISSEIIDSDKVLEIIVPEGVKFIRPNCFYCRNLCSISLPSTLVEIGENAIHVSPFKKIEIIDSNNSYFRFYKTSFGYYSTILYFSERCKIFHEKSQNIGSLEDVLQLLKMFDALSLFDFFIANDLPDDLKETLTKQKQNLSNDMLSVLNQKQQEIEIGYILVEKTFNNNSRLSLGLLLYLFYKECLKNNVEYKPISFSTFLQQVALAETDGTVSIGVWSLINHAKKKTDGTSLQVNLHFIYAIFHELQHLRQRKFKSYESIPLVFPISMESIQDRIDFIDSNIQQTADGFQKGHGYTGFHDIFPDEIMADINAYDSLLELFSMLQLNNINACIDFINNRKLDRIEKAHAIDKKGNIGILDFRDYAYECLLSHDNLSSQEKSKIKDIKVIYKAIKELAESHSIDLYDSTLRWYFDYKKRLR